MSTETNDVATHSVAVTLTGNGCPGAPCSRAELDEERRRPLARKRRVFSCTRNRNERTIERTAGRIGFPGNCQRERRTAVLKLTTRFTEVKTLNEHEKRYLNEADRTKMFLTITISVFALNAFWTFCQAVPLIDLRDTLEQNVLDAVVASACSSNGGCWEWLPVEEVGEDDGTIPGEQPMSKIHVRRETSNIDPNTVIESWGDTAPSLNRKVHQSMSTKQMGNRLSKKDVLTPRSWGAGGMPFSVLYMNPHGPRGNHGSAGQQQELVKAETPSPSTNHPNSRIALRNGSSTQPRRQYSIIPQLFISYGWGSFGK